VARINQSFDGVDFNTLITRSNAKTTHAMNPPEESTHDVNPLDESTHNVSLLEESTYEVIPHSDSLYDTSDDEGHDTMPWLHPTPDDVSIFDGDEGKD
jgi:hypothetical protein